MNKQEKQIVEAINTIGHDFELIELGLRNFLSFGNMLSVIPLNQKHTTHVNGENLDMGGSSGSGKSTIIHAITFALFDKTIASIGKERLINRTNASKSTQMEVVLTFRKLNDVYRIERRRGEKNELFLYKNEVDETLDSISNTNKKIEEIVGISYDLFVRVIVFNGSATPFLDLPVSEQRAQIEELLKITALSEKATVLKEQCKENEKNAEIQKVLIEQMEKQAAQYQQYVSQAENRVVGWEVERETSLGKLGVELSGLKAIDIEAEKKKIDDIIEADAAIQLGEQARTAAIAKSNTLMAEKTSIESELKSIEQAHNFNRLELINVRDSRVTGFKNQTLSLELQKKNTAAELSTAKKTKQRFESDISKVDGELKHLTESKCPFCLQSMPNAADKIDELTTKIDAMRADLVKTDAEIDKLSQSVLDIEAEIAQVTNQIQNDSQVLELNQMIDTFASVSTNAEWIEVRGRIEAKDLEIAERKNLNETVIDDLVKLKDACSRMPVSSYKNRGDLDRIEVGVKHTEEAIAQLAAEENPHGDALEKLLKEVQPKIDYDKLNGLVKMVTHQKFLIKLLTDKNSFIRKRIISKTIPFLNERLDEYIGKLNLPHTVKFQADMTCEIAEFNRILDHGNLSNGERRRLNLALSLAFRDVLGHLHGRMSSLMCDEIDAGALDSVNVDCMLKLMKEKAKKDNLSVYMISHRPEFEGRCDHTMMIRKENGFSNVVGS